MSGIISKIIAEKGGMKVTLKIRDLKAIALFAARDDMRPILQGVCVEYTLKRIRLVATNEHILGLIERPSNSDDLIEPGSLVIQTEVIKQATSFLPRNVDSIILQTTKVKGEFRLGNVVFEPRSEKPGVTRYPNYRKVLIDKTSGEPGVYNPEYIMQFAKAERMLWSGKKCVSGIRFGYNGKTGACVILSKLVGEFYGLLMPIRTEPFSGIQDWIEADVDAEATAKVIRKQKEIAAAQPVAEILKINFDKKEQVDGTGYRELSEAQPETAGSALPGAGSQTDAGADDGDSAPASQDVRESSASVAGPEAVGAEEGGEVGEASSTTDLR